MEVSDTGMLPGHPCVPHLGAFALAALSPWTAPPLSAPSILEFSERPSWAAPGNCVSGGRHHLNSPCGRLFHGLWGPLPAPPLPHTQRSCLCFWFSWQLPEATTLTFEGSSTVTSSSHPDAVSFLATLPSSSSLLQSRVYSPVQCTTGLRRHTRARP